MRMRAGTQKVRNTENGPRTFPSMLPVCSQKNRNDGGELSRQWNTQPARPTAGSPQAPPAYSDTHIRHTHPAREATAEHIRKRRAPEQTPGARHHSLSKKQLSRQQLTLDY